jgi:hypothetical protein
LSGGTGAVVLFEESLVLAVEVGHGSIATGCLEGLAYIVATRERPRRAVRLWAAAEALREAASVSREGAERPLYKAGLEAAHEQLEVGASTEAWTERLAMTVTEAVVEALDQRE